MSLTEQWQESALNSEKSINALMASESAKTLKSDKTTTVTLVRLSGRQVIVKRYNDRNFWHIIKKAFRQTRARRCWVMSQQFAAAGLNVANPLTIFEKRYGPVRRQSYFVSDYLQGQTLLECLPILDQQTREEIKREILDAFQIMQQRMLSHGDMKASNLIWAQGQLYFIDLDAATKHRTIGSWSRAHQKDKLRFMKNWNGDSELSALFKDLS